MTTATAPNLDALYGAPSALALRKTMPALDAHGRKFVALSPFLVLGTRGADGGLDVSPRGDLPGFVAVLDARTLLIPDRPGNNRLDSLRNVQADPHVALIFFIPGVDETFRVNGTAAITADPDLLAPLAMNGRAPKSGLVVAVHEAFLHCTKALVRAKLWRDDHRVDRGTAFPSLARMISDQTGGGFDLAAAEERVAQSVKERLY